MTVLATGDIRGFYESLGVVLPDRAVHEAAVRCFSSPESHRNGDRSPSASISLVSGAWCCHACGARGGAYDAAVALGHRPREAIELMITHGLIERRSEPGSRAPNRLQSAPELRRPPTPPARERPRLEATDADVARWQSSLSRRPSLISRLAQERGRRYGVICALEVGLDPGGRLTIPIRTVSSTYAWRPEWASALAGRRVCVVMDCDRPGREAANRIASDLAPSSHVTVLDLDPARSDGYDLTDALLDQRHRSLELPALARLERTLARSWLPDARGLER